MGVWMNASRSFLTGGRPGRGLALCGALLAAWALFVSPAAHAQDDAAAGTDNAAASTDAAAATDVGDEAPTESAPTSGDAPSDSDIKDEARESADEIKATDEGIGLTLQDRIRAVSRKTFIKAGRFEFAPFGGVSTNDAFFRRWTVGARLSYHIFDSLSIDVGGAANLWSQELDPVRVVAQQLNAIPDEAVLFGMGDIGITFAPIYGKIALMSEWIIHFDVFVSGGVGATIDSNQYTFLGQELPDFMPGINPAAEIGIGTRIFVFRWLVLRADLRDYAYPQYRGGISTLQNLLMLNVGVGFYFPFDFEYQYTAARVVEG
jgi:outer membrane beta-barrel protein